MRGLACDHVCMVGRVGQLQLCCALWLTLPVHKCARHTRTALHERMSCTTARLSAVAVWKLLRCAILWLPTAGAGLAPSSSSCSAGGCQPDSGMSELIHFSFPYSACITKADCACTKLWAAECAVLRALQASLVNPSGCAFLQPHAHITHGHSVL